MKVGLTLPQIGPQATRENVIHLAKSAEDEGFNSLWVSERLLWPLKPSVPYPTTSDGGFPTEYQNVLDPLELLTFVAAKTDRIALGTSIVDMLFHSPVILARRFATLDVLSQGRVIAGLGIGAFKEEYQVSNVTFQNRGERADEFIKALKSIWMDDVVEFNGKYYNIPASKVGPKPVQKPHIPVYLGGFNPNTFTRIVSNNVTGWIGGAFGPLDHVAKSAEMLSDTARQANKNSQQFKIVILAYPNVWETGSSSSSNNDQDQGQPFSGTVEQIGEDMKKLKEVGIEEIILSYNFIPTGRDVDRIIDTSKALARYAR